MKLLILGDETGVYRSVCELLRAHGLEVTVAESLDTALALVERTLFDAMVVDLTIPDDAIPSVVDRFRRSNLAAHLVIVLGFTTESTRVAALDRGADDVLARPLSVSELVARVRGVLRRRGSTQDAIIQLGSLTIDPNGRSVSAHGRSVELANKEFDLLYYLAARPGEVFSRDHLLKAVWESTSEWQHATTVTEHVRRLRGKIEENPRRPQFLRTVRGAGYRLDPPDPAGGHTGSGTVTDVPTHPDTPTTPTSGNDQVGPHTGRPERGSNVVPGTLVHVGGRVVWADQPAAAFLGCADASELLGTAILDLVAPRSRAAAEERMAITTSRHSQLIDLVRVDGTEITVEMASTTAEWEGQPACRVSIAHALDPSALLVGIGTGVLGEVTDAVIMTDLHFHVRAWNQAAERLFGSTEDEVLGRHIVDALDLNRDTDDLVEVWETLQITGRWTGEGPQVVRDGAISIVAMTMALLRDDRGEPIGIVSVNRLGSIPSDHDGDEVEPDEYDMIQRGLVNDEFEVFYQPIVTLADLGVTKVEALARWNHPERGLITSAAFIGAAERSGLIIDLGLAVLDKACRQVAQWRQEGSDLDLTVNISARQLSDPMLGDRITQVLATSELPPQCLWLEVTESALVHDIDTAAEVLRRVVDLGVRVAIDDFGTGWASLTYLRLFPVHAIKIDRSFVAGVDHDVHDVAIVRSVVSLGIELGVEVIAEGIETPAQERALQRLGCSIGQGYLYGRPTPAREVPSRIRRMAMAGRPTRSGDSAHDAPPARSTIARRDLTASASGPGARGEVTEELDGLDNVGSAAGVIELLHQVIRELGGSLVPATDADGDALPIDVALGSGPPMLVSAEPMSVARLQLERVVPQLVERARRRFLDLAAAGRVGPAMDLALELVSGGQSVERLVVDVLAPVQREVGALWQANEWTVAQEHAASAVIDAVLGAVGMQARTVRPSRGSVLVACVEEEYHTLPARMGVEWLRSDGWDVMFLGATVPAGDLQAFVARNEIEVVVLSCTVPMFLPGAARCIGALADLGVAVVAAGAGFGDSPRRAERLGASAWIGSGMDPTSVLTGGLAPAGPVHETNPEAIQLELAADELIVACLAELFTRIPQMQAYSAVQLAHTKADLGYILRYLGVAVDMDEPGLFEEFIAWLTQVLAARGVPAKVLHHSLDIVAGAVAGVGLERSATICAAARDELIQV